MKMSVARQEGDQIADVLGGATPFDTLGVQMARL